MRTPDGGSTGGDFGDPFDGGGGGRDFGGETDLQEDPDPILDDEPTDAGGDSTPDRDSGGGGGGGGGSTSPSPTRTVSGSTTLDSTLTQPVSTVREAAPSFEPIDAAAPFTGAAVVAGAAQGLQQSDPAQDFRQFQRNTTPIEDAGRGTRQFLSRQSGVGIPTTQEAATEANEAIGGVAGTSPREARLDARSAALRGVDSGVDTAVDAVPGDERGVAAGATALAVAEPTPFGEAALFGASAAAGLGGSTLTNPDQGSQEVPRSPFGGAEVDAPTDPTGQRPVEVDVPDEPPGTDGEVAQPDSPTIDDPEVAQPDDPTVGIDSELDTGDGTGTDAGIQLAPTGQLRERPEDEAEEDADDDLGPDIDPFDRSDRRLFDQRREFGDDIGGMAEDGPTVDPDSAESRQDIGGGIAEGGEPGVRGSDAESFSERGFGDVSGTELDPNPTDTFGRFGVRFPGDGADAVQQPELDSPTDAVDQPVGSGAGSGTTPLAPGGLDTDPLSDGATPDTQGGVDLDTGFTPRSDTDATPTQDAPPTQDSPPTTDTTPDSDTAPDSDTGTGSGTATATSLVEASATIDAVEATPSDFGDVELNAQPREAATATPGIANPTSGRPRRPRRPRAPDFDREPQAPDFDTLVTEGETVTNPTQSLSAVDEDLQEVFDGPP